MTLEELHAHYKAVRARIEKGGKKEPSVRLIYPELEDGPYPDPLDLPKPAPEPRRIAPPTPETLETPARKILIEVADKHKMPVAAFRSPIRKMQFVNLRREACYRLSTELGFSLSQIGRLMGNQDHTTVLHSIRQHKKILAEGYKPKTRTKSSVSSARVTQVEPRTQNDHV